MNHHHLSFGTAQIRITPSTSIPLAGFAYRENQPFTSIASDIFVKAFAFRVGERTACIVTADIIWWPPEPIATIRELVASRWGIKPVDLLLHATHTHSAPQTSSSFTPGLGALKEEWQQRLFDALSESIGLAIESLQPAHIARFRGTSAISLNRRVDKGVDPVTPRWPDGELDREVTTLVMTTERGMPLGALVHFSCHPTILRGAIVSAEFPGVMCDRIAEYLGGDCIVGFLQGCCGDVGPATSETDPLTTNYDEVQRIGHILAEDVTSSFNDDGEVIVPDASSGVIAKVPLAFDLLPTKHELVWESARADYIGDWARYLLSEPDQRFVDHADLEIQHFRLGANLSILAFNAEMVSHYGLQAKERTHGTALGCGYSNGMIGYVVTDDQLQNGGYEVDESTKYFGLPSRFASGTQRQIDDSIVKILTSTL